MALTQRQQRLYAHRIDIWRKTEVIGLDGKIGQPTWAKNAASVACYAETGQSQQGLDGPILDENDNLFTFDKFHAESSINIQVGDVIKMVSGPEAGKFWTVRGNEQHRTRRANKLMILCSREPLPPVGVA